MNITLIDVRQPEELQMDGAIEGAVNIPLATVPFKIRRNQGNERRYQKSFSVEVEEEAD